MTPFFTGPRIGTSGENVSPPTTDHKKGQKKSPRVLFWKWWCLSIYWSMLSSTALVCIVDLTSIVDLICVCWDVTYAEELLP